MAANMRAQVSLMFDDSDLFDNFITPCKEERRLNGIIIKCLSAYYYNENVRNLVEGATLEGISEYQDDNSTQSICDSIRASLFVQDYIIEEFKQAVDTGKEDVSSILSRANQQAEKKGYGTSKQTKSGSTILQLEAPKQDVRAESASTDVTAGASGSAVTVETLIQAVFLLAKTQNNEQALALLGRSVGQGTAVEGVQITETPRQIVVPEVRPAYGDVGTVSPIEEKVIEVSDKNDFEVEQTSEPEDAADAMRDLLASLNS